MNNINIALIQMRTRDIKEKNLLAAEGFVRKASEGGADFAVLPEMFICPYKTDSFPAFSEPMGGPAFNTLSKIAKDNGIYLVAGSVPESDHGRVYNTSYVFDRSGSLIGKHRKVHLFDINVEGGQYFKESDTLSPGDSVTVFDTEFGRMGLMICYDIRFPEMTGLMSDMGAKIIFVPGAFNMTTGPAHWELLFRTRALDGQVYMAGVSPARDKDGVYVSYGNSIVTSPWGDVVERLDEKEGLRIVSIDPEKTEKVREQLPVLKHKRTDVYGKYRK